MVAEIELMVLDTLGVRIIDLLETAIVVNDQISVLQLHDTNYFLLFGCLEFKVNLLRGFVEF